MSIRHFMKIVTESQQLDELFGLRTGPKQSELYPENEFTRYGEDHNRGPMGLPDMGHGYNFNRFMPDIEKHPDFVRLVDAFDDEDRYSLQQEMDMCQRMAQDLGHSTFQIHDYCARGPFYRRMGSYDSSKFSPTDGPTSPYNDPKSFEYDGDNPDNDLPGVVRGADGKIKYIPGVDD